MRARCGSLGSFDQIRRQEAAEQHRSAVVLSRVCSMASTSSLVSPMRRLCSASMLPRCRWGSGRECRSSVKPPNAPRGPAIVGWDLQAAVSGLLPGPFAYAERWGEKSGTYLEFAVERAVNAVVVIDSDSVIVTPMMADSHRPMLAHSGPGDTVPETGDGTPAPDETVSKEPKCVRWSRIPIGLASLKSRWNCWVQHCELTRYMRRSILIVYGRSCHRSGQAQ